MHPANVWANSFNLRNLTEISNIAAIQNQNFDIDEIITWAGFTSGQDHSSSLVAKHEKSSL